MSSCDVFLNSSLFLQRSEGQNHALKQQMAQIEDQMVSETELLRTEVICSQRDLSQALQVRDRVIEVSLLFLTLSSKVTLNWRLFCEVVLNKKCVFRRKASYKRRWRSWAARVGGICPRCPPSTVCSWPRPVSRSATPRWSRPTQSYRPTSPRPRYDCVPFCVPSW